MKIDDFTFVQKSGYVFFLMRQDLSHNLYFKIFLCFWRSFSRSNKTGNPGQL